ncbi:hypothetical protein HDE_07972 [Halotydeus destructor]|nr:hypothetical protein HDE_07972 [Halotydeus destructor]
MEAIESLSEFKVHVLLSDMGPSNLKLWNKLGVGHTKHNIDTMVTFPGRSTPLNVMPDISHLIKNFRNFLVSRPDAIRFKPSALQILKRDSRKTFSDLISVETFDAIVEMQEANPKTFDRTLTKKTVHPEHYAKMKVAHAERLLSSKAIDDINRLVAAKKISPELVSKSLTLSAFIDTFSMFYRLVTSRDATTKHKSPRFKLLFELLDKIDILFGDMETFDRKWKPWMSGFMMYTDGIRSLFRVLSVEDQAIEICIGLLSTDAIESLFSQLKAKNPHPTADEVKLALRRLVASNMCEAKLRGNVASTDHENELSLKDLQNYRVAENDIPFIFADDAEEYIEDLDVYQTVAEIQSSLLKAYHCDHCEAFYSLPSGPIEIAGHQPTLACSWPIFGVCGLLENCFTINERFLHLHSKNSLNQFITKFFLFIDIAEYEVSLGAPDCHASVRDVIYSYFQNRVRKYIQFQSKKVSKTHASLTGARVTQIENK